MTAPPATGPAVSAAELSCYTAALGCYLQNCLAGALARIARSVRLAVRTDPGSGLTAFSHHGVSLADLGRGYRLAYRGTTSPGDLLTGLDRELDAAGGALVVTYTVAMSWSAARQQHNAPHFVLLTSHDGDQWHIKDPFRAQLPDGYQEPFSGWIPGWQLISAMTPPARLSPEHRLRLQHAFGGATPLRPDQEFQWLGRAPGVPSAALGPGWITEPLAALDYLSDFWASLSEYPDRIRHLDDMWAAARHHAFRYAYLLSHGQLDAPAAAAAETARQAWAGLPMTLRFAAESAARGRSRTAMIRDLFGQLSTAERGIAPTLAAHGYGPGRVVSDTGPASPDGKEN